MVSKFLFAIHNETGFICYIMSKLVFLQLCHMVLLFYTFWYVSKMQEVLCDWKNSVAIVSSKNGRQTLNHSNPWVATIRFPTGTERDMEKLCQGNHEFLRVSPGWWDFFFSVFWKKTGLDTRPSKDPHRIENEMWIVIHLCYWYYTALHYYIQ